MKKLNLILCFIAQLLVFSISVVVFAGTTYNFGSLNNWVLNYISNSASGGTVLNTLTKQTGAPATVTEIGTADVIGILGICIQNCGTTGTATIQSVGIANCIFDGPTTAGDYVQSSTMTAGDCHDTGFMTYPTTVGQVIGRAQTTNAAAGTYAVNLAAPDTIAPSGNGGALALTIVGSPTVGPATLTTNFTATPTGGTPPYTYAWTFGDSNTSFAQNPSHNYAAGTYTASLTVTDSASPAHTATQVKTVLVTGTPYYVAKSGSDSNNGLTPATAFLTITKCQTAMQSGNKVCIINDSGTYTLGASLLFTASDQGEVWTAGFGQTPIIDGNSGNYYVNVTGVTSFAFYGVTFQNMGLHTGVSSGAFNVGGSGLTLRWNKFLSTTREAITGNFTNVSGSTFDSNTISGGGLATWSFSAFDAAIHMGGSTGNISVTHNLCQNRNDGCVEFNTASTGQANNKIDNNLGINVIQGCADCGFVYMYDQSANPPVATGNEFKNNALYSNTDPAFLGKCIYLDTWTANTTVSGNICASYNAGTAAGITSPASGGPPEPAELDLQISGQNDTVTNNIFEVGGATTSYADFSDCTPNHSPPFTGAGCSNFEQGSYLAADVVAGETGRGFNHNIVFTRGAQTPVWNPNGLVTFISGSPSAWTIAADDFFSTTGVTFPPGTWNAQWVYRAGNSTSWVDSTKVTSNPMFVNPSLNNYQLTNPPAGWTTLQTNQGPINSPFVAAGSAF